jgi:hypothetical protein
MAMFPCDHHGGRYRGAQRTVYPAIVNGSMSMREKRRLCLDCFSAVEQFCSGKMLDAESPYEAEHCLCCENEYTPFAVFVTLYPGRDERHDYYGRACASCAAGEAAMALFGKQTSF